MRGWSKAPVFVLASVGTLALGIGANTTIFSVVSGVLLRPLPFARPEAPVQVYETDPGDRFQISPAGLVRCQDFEGWLTRSNQLEAYWNSGMNLQDLGKPMQVAKVAAERGMFRLLAGCAGGTNI